MPNGACFLSCISISLVPFSVSEINPFYFNEHIIICKSITFIVRLAGSPLWAAFCLVKDEGAVMLSEQEGQYHRLFVMVSQEKQKEHLPLCTV